MTVEGEMDGQERGRDDAFFGRRVGRPLKPAQRRALDTHLERLRLDLESPAPRDLASLFKAEVDRFVLEIGFGGGEHLLAGASVNGRTGFIGVEPFRDGMAKLARALDDVDLTNLRLHDDDAVAVLDWLPEGSLDRIDLLYPDPWRKTRHHKRRFVNPDNLARIARVLRQGGEFRFASDWADYVNWTLAHASNCDELCWNATGAKDWREPYDGWPGTRYEAKAVREGRIPAYLRFERR